MQKVGGGVQKVGGGMQRAGGGTASASELRAAEEEIKRLKDQVGLHLFLSTSLLARFQKCILEYKILKWLLEGCDCRW